jgi:hypothetical protein
MFQRENKKGLRLLLVTEKMYLISPIFSTR